MQGEATAEAAGLVATTYRIDDGDWSSESRGERIAVEMPGETAEAIRKEDQRATRRTRRKRRAVSFTDAGILDGQVPQPKPPSDDYEYPGSELEPPNFPTTTCLGDLAPWTLGRRAMDGEEGRGCAWIWVAKVREPLESPDRPGVSQWAWADTPRVEGGEVVRYVPVWVGREIPKEQAALRAGVKAGLITRRCRFCGHVPDTPAGEEAFWACLNDECSRHGMDRKIPKGLAKPPSKTPYDPGAAPKRVKR